MDNFNKYLGLLFLLIGGFFGFVLSVAILIFILRLFSITLFNIPGFDSFFQYFIIIIPYLIFFAAYYYLRRKITKTKKKVSGMIAMLLFGVGIIICFLSFLFSSLSFFGVKAGWLQYFEEPSHYYLVIQLFLLFLIAAFLASGDPKEKDWMERTAE